VVVLAAVNYRGVQRTAHATRVILAAVLVALAVTVTGLLGGGRPSTQHLADFGSASVWDILRAAAFFFFAFAGYARLATLGEEVREPVRTIPRAIPLALTIALAVYAAVAIAALVAAGPQALATSDAPLAAAVGRGSLSSLEPVVRAGAAVASLGVLLSLVAGISRTLLAMGRTRDLPSWLAAVHPRYRVPHHAEVAVGLLVSGLVITTDLRHAIGFSSFTVLAYYAIANATAWTLPRAHRRASRVVPTLGLVGCVALAVTLPTQTVITGACALAAGALVWAVRRVHGSAPKATRL
jgi:APA family basic amino acid/polyamine antiporter